MIVKGKNICDSCFNELDDDGNTCSGCGFDKENYTQELGVLSIGDILMGRYSIGKILGRGGFGVTYLGYDLNSGKKVAIKEYLPDGLATRQTGQLGLTIYTGEKEKLFKNGAERFFEEAKTVARFNGNPNIVHVYEFFHENNTAYFAMEYIEGIDLKQYLIDHGKVDVREAVKLLEPIIDALIIVHSIGVLHRDISPDNIYIANDDRVILLDFGAARQILGEESKSLSIVLKQGFAPIEQYQTRGNFGAWSDIYAFCATFYFAITGIVPVAAMDRMDEDMLLPPSQLGVDIPQGLESVIMKGLNFRATDRQQDMVSFKQEFTNVSQKLTDAREVNIEPEAAATFIETEKEIEENVVSLTEEINNEPIIKQKGKKKKGLIFGSIGVVVFLVAIALFAFSGQIDNLVNPKVEVSDPTITATTSTDGSTTATLSNPNSFGTIYYTVDGSDPLTNSKKYDAPITLTATTNLKVRVIDEEDNMSNITSQQFTIVEKVVEKTVEKPVEVAAPPSEGFMNNIKGTWRVYLPNGGKEDITFTKLNNGLGHMLIYQYGSNTTGSCEGDFIMNNVTEGHGEIVLINVREYGLSPNTYQNIIECEPYGDNAISINGLSYQYVTN